MCFSAQASFAASAVIAPAGVYCVQCALAKNRRYLPLALLPLGFAVQQVSEGVLWLALDRNDAALVQASALFFLFFALAFWPFWLPFCASVVESRQPLRLALAGFTLLSLAWTVFLFAPILVDPERWLTVRVVHHSIVYDYGDLPVYQYVSPGWLRVLYLLTIGIPLLVAETKGPGFGVRRFGLLFAVSAAFATLVFSYAFVSVWCFFAAVLTVCLALVFHRMPAQRGMAEEREMRSGWPGSATAH